MTKATEDRVTDLRAAVAAGRESGNGRPVDEVLDRLEARYRALAANKRH